MKKFFVLWASQAASIFGSSVVGFALAWYLAKETGSATILSIAMLANFAPAVVLGPFIGPLIDRWDRKKIMIVGDLVTALLTMVLVILFYTNTAQVWHIYVVIAGRAISGSFQGPALAATVPLIVPEKLLVRAGGLSRMRDGAINIIGPLTGAFLMEALSVQWVLSVDIITAAVAIGCLIPLGIPRPSHTTLAKKRNLIGDMVQGIRYVTSWKGLLFLLLLCALLNFLSAPLNSLLPLFVRNYLGGEVSRMGYLQTAFGVGIIAGGLILGAWSGFKRRIVTSLTGIIFWTVAVFAISFTTERLFWLGLAMAFVAGLGMTIFNAPIGAILQSTVPKDMQGRVFTVINSMSTGMMIPGLLLAGPLADSIGVRAILIISGAAAFVVVLAGFSSRDLMEIENQKAAEKTTGEAATPLA